MRNVGARVLSYDWLARRLFLTPGQRIIGITQTPDDLGNLTFHVLLEGEGLPEHHGGMAIMVMEPSSEEIIAEGLYRIALGRLADE